ncbi:sensor histidine kinase [Yoonia litorea]|uniref:sensor histidine kinase n=1 Tax=Yoonia litorea TaxID=1123755 RepID=UPI000B7DC350|nr:HWE histidine kinase domain-containing protein [Yoonia litorea]
MKHEGQIQEQDWREAATIHGDAARFIWYIDTDTCEIDETLREMTGLSHAVGRVSSQVFLGQISEGDLSFVTLAVKETVETGQPYRAEFRFVRPDGEVIWLAGHGELTETENGERVIVGINYDITQLRKEQERANLVSYEMNHRIKNIFTIVSSLFRASARKTETKEELVDAFEKRLNALTALNSVVMANGNMAASLTRVVETVLAPFNEGRIRYAIDDLQLNNTTAQTIALVLNELATNAIKYGGLSPQGGGVDLRVTTTDETFRLQWTEDAGRRIEPPAKANGFGMSVLTGMTASTFAGKPEIVWHDTGFAFSCTWPIANVRDESTIAGYFADAAIADQGAAAPR